MVCSAPLIVNEMRTGSFAISEHEHHHDCIGNKKNVVFILVVADGNVSIRVPIREVRVSRKTFQRDAEG